MNQTKKLFHSIQGIAMTEMSIKKTNLVGNLPTRFV